MILRLTIISLLAITPHIVQAESLSEQIHTCRNINASQDRLACYDNLLLNESIDNKELIVNVTKNEKVIDNTNFGQEYKLRNTTSDKINVSILSIKKSLRGKLKITLKNGQEWHQTDSSSFKIDKEKETYIKKGALSSFYMGQTGRNRTIKVKRVK